MTYEFDGKQYKKASVHQTSWGESMVERLPIKGTELILDIGCGDGRVTQKIALRVPDGEVLGIDASNSMIAAAKKYESANLRFKVISVNELSFHEHFDVVFSHAALHWIRDHDLLLKKIYKSLRSGGYARLNFAADGASPTLIQVIKTTMGNPSYAKYFSNFLWPWYMPSSIEYKKILSRSPFQDAEVLEEHKERLFPSADSLIKWIDQPCLAPFLAVITEKDKQGFRDSIIDQMLQKTKQATGGFLEQFCRLDILTRK
ncbi:MAG: methyltransferase domain-containing protein [Desulfobulbus sp.]|nr:methyltransferase domain-containing protein [Desulfobulbus sp.]